MKKEEEEILETAILNSMRYVYEGVRLSTPINEDEWKGDEQYGGVKDYILTIVRSFVGTAFKSGYVIGSKDAFDALNKENSELEWSIEDAQVGAERRFLAWEKI